jgi:hypothetical protein
MTKHPLPGRYTHFGWDVGVLWGLSVPAGSACPACTLRRQIHCSDTRSIS